MRWNSKVVRASRVRTINRIRTKITVSSASKYRSINSKLKSLIDFINLPWAESVLDHTITAKSRTHISTASYNQVTEKIYQTAKGRWINYEEQLSRVIPKLSPFIKKFGY